LITEVRESERMLDAAGSISSPMASVCLPLSVVICLLASGLLIHAHTYVGTSEMEGAERVLDAASYPIALFASVC
jgi:hypothetical protein